MKSEHQNINVECAFCKKSRTIIIPIHKLTFNHFLNELIKHLPAWTYKASLRTKRKNFKCDECSQL